MSGTFWTLTLSDCCTTCLLHSLCYFNLKLFPLSETLTLLIWTFSILGPVIVPGPTRIKKSRSGVSLTWLDDQTMKIRLANNSTDKILLTPTDNMPGGLFVPCLFSGTFEGGCVWFMLNILTNFHYNIIYRPFLKLSIDIFKKY